MKNHTKSQRIISVICALLMVITLLPMYEAKAAATPYYLTCLDIGNDGALAINKADIGSLSAKINSTVTVEGWVLSTVKFTSYTVYLSRGSNPPSKTIEANAGTYPFSSTDLANFQTNTGKTFITANSHWKAKIPLTDITTGTWTISVVGRVSGSANSTYDIAKVTLNVTSSSTTTNTPNNYAVCNDAPNPNATKAYTKNGPSKVEIPNNFVYGKTTSFNVSGWALHDRGINSYWYTIKNKSTGAVISGKQNIAISALDRNDLGPTAKSLKISTGNYVTHTWYNGNVSISGLGAGTYIAYIYGKTNDGQTFAVAEITFKINGGTTPKPDPEPKPKKDTYKIIYHYLDGYFYKDRTEVVTAEVGKNVTLKNLTGSSAVLKDGSIIIGWQLYEMKNTAAIPRFKLGETVAYSKLIVTNKEVNIYPVIRYSYTVYYSPLDMTSYEKTYLRLDEKVKIAPVSAVSVNNNKECIGFMDLTAGKVVYPGETVSMTDLVEVDWADREKAARYPANYLKDGHIYDKNGLYVGPYRADGSGREPYNVTLVLNPILRSKGSDDYASDNGGIYVGEVKDNATPDSPLTTYWQRVDFFLTQKQVRSLYPLLNMIDDNENYIDDSSWLSKIGNALSPVGLIQAFLGLAAEEGAKGIVATLGGAKIGLALAAVSFIIEAVEKDDKDFVLKLINEMKKLKVFSASASNGIHIVVEISHDVGEKIDGTFVYSTPKTKLISIEKYDNVLLHHDAKTKNGQWVQRDIEKTFESIVANVYPSYSN